MPVPIPCTPNGISHWAQRTTLDGRDYQLTFDWNQRDGHWRLDIADQDAAPIRSGIVLTSTSTLLRGCIDARRPPGEIVVVDTQAKLDLDPGFSDLGDRFLLLYFTAAEIA